MGITAEDYATAAGRQQARADRKTIEEGLRGLQHTTMPLTARFVVPQTVEGKVAVNTGYLIVSATPTATELQTAADALADAWYTHLGATMCTAWSQGAVTVRGLNSANDPEAISSHNVGQPGGDTVDGSNPMPRSLSPIVTLSTGLGGRTHRGRWYLVGTAQAGLSDVGRGVLSVPTVTALNTAVQAISTAMTAAGFPLAVGSRKLGTSAPVINCSVAAQCGTQRRRLRG